MIVNVALNILFFLCAGNDEPHASRSRNVTAATNGQVNVDYHEGILSNNGIFDLIIRFCL